MLKTLQGVGVTEFLERKSRFIGYANIAETEEQAAAFIQKIKSKHRDATHNVYAYQVGPFDECQRSSDDGEPAGTAGRPVLEVIKNQQLKNTVVVVTRYFGGILLGAGGLVRAYSKTAALALDAAGIIYRIPAQTYSLSFAYTNLGRIKSFLSTQGYEIFNTVYQDKVTMLVAVPEDETALFLKQLEELACGTVKAVAIGETGWLERRIE